MKKLNLGCGNGWNKEGWIGFDHMQRSFFAHEAWRLPYPDDFFDIVFSSHMLEHVPVQKLEETFVEINRVMKPGGVFRFLTPDLYKICSAYVNGDEKLMKQYVNEDGVNIKMQYGLGQAVLGFIHSPGFDNILLSSRADEMIGAIAHCSMIDFQIAQGLLEHYGFVDIKRGEFCSSDLVELREPSHFLDEPAVWKQYSGVSQASVKVTGFDRDPLISLIVECKKGRHVPFRIDAPQLYGDMYNGIRKHKSFVIIRMCTRLIKYINGVLFYLNGIFKKLRSMTACL